MLRVCLAVLLALALAATGVAQTLLAPGEMRLAHDLLPLLERATLEHPGVAEHRNPAFSAGRALDAIFLHPPSEDVEATLTFPPLTLLGDGTPMLFFSIGMQDGFAWDDAKNPPDGVRFSARINDEVVFSESLTDHGWRLRALDLSRWQGQPIVVCFATHKIAGTSYDWALFGEPRIMNLQAMESIEALGPRVASPGIALVQIEASAPSRVRVQVGERSDALALPTGVTLLPVEYAVPAVATLAVAEGAATITATRYVAHSPKLTWIDLYTTPVIPFVGETYDLVACLKNVGRGSLVSLPDFELLGTVREVPSVPTLGASLPVAPRDEVVLLWPALRAESAGEQAVSLRVPGATPETGKYAFSIASERPKTAHALPWHPALGENTGWVRYAIPETDFALSFFMNEGACMAYLEQSGKTIATLASLGGLHQIDKDVPEEPFELPNGLPIDFAAPRNGPNTGASFQVTSIEPISGGGVILCGESWESECRLEITPEDNGRRLHLHYRIDRQRPMHRLAMASPLLILGGGSTDTPRTFATFPGLEFIEGAEGSSSTRDLTPPLHKRYWPEAYKIAAPLIAVASEEVLIGLVWSAPSAFFHPSNPRPAYFDAPAHERGVARMRACVPLQNEDLHPEADFWLVLQDRDAYERLAGGQDTSRAAFVLDMYRHYSEVFGMPVPTPQPRGWAEEKALCADAYLNAVGSADPPGFRHCAGWEVGTFSAHAVPVRLLLRDGLPDEAAQALGARVDAVVARAVKEQGPGALASNAGVHIVHGETPFFEGYVGESLRVIREQGFQWLDKREDGVWKWHPGDARSASLGKDGDHTLGQAALGARIVLRAARLSGNLSLRAQALDALKILEQYAVPRGAQTWECPLYQPDLLAAAHAVSAYMDAYQLTGDRHHIAQAAYWAKTGLPFIYFWSPTGHPAMLYNTIPVFGSTWFTHSWIGLPVVWCGLVYAYALQDLAPYDDSFEWRVIAQGITNSAMHQQYVDGPSKGCFPDSWNVIAGTPNPADINPEDIIVNECRLRGNSAEVRTRRVPGRVGESLINSAFDLPAVIGEVGRGKLGLVLQGKPGFPGYTAIVPAQDPASVEGAGARAADSAALAKVPTGWIYDREAQALILKHTPATEEWKSEIVW